MMKVPPTEIMVQQPRVAEPQLESAETDLVPCEPQVSCAFDPSKPTSFRNTIQISRSDMEKYFHCPQRLAAQKLGVSLSTLKRRFYQLNIGRWPHQSTPDKRRTSVWHLLNEVEPKNEKELCPNTVQTLSHLFSMNLQEQQQLATSQRMLSINGSESPHIKFLRYVPRNETLSQSLHCGSKGIRKKQRRFLQIVDNGPNTSDGSPKRRETNRKRQTHSVSRNKSCLCCLPSLNK